MASCNLSRGRKVRTWCAGYGILGIVLIASPLHARSNLSLPGRGGLGGAGIRVEGIA